ncbi:MAG: response regulator [Pirellulales bacterium]
MTQILVVDDSRLSRRMIVDALQQTGHDITEAVNGAVALESFRQNRPDCIVSNLLMPVMDGHEMLRQIRAIDSAVPVIIASADIQQSSRAQCEELGISGFLTKPIQAEALLECVEAILIQTAGVETHGTE